MIRHGRAGELLRVSELGVYLVEHTLRVCTFNRPPGRRVKKERTQ
jgi:hypothetical protein